MRWMIGEMGDWMIRVVMFEKLLKKCAEQVGTEQVCGRARRPHGQHVYD